MNYKSDLAIEWVEMAKEVSPDNDNIQGVSMNEIQYDKGVKATRIKIENSTGAGILGKPQGNYITIEAEGIVEEKEGVKEAAEKALFSELSKIIKFHYNLKVLLVGLGNIRVTPDSLGPKTAAKIKVTRHLFLIFNADGDDEMSCVSAITPGVSATTGMETADIVTKAIELTMPDVVIAIDSLAAKNIERMSTTIQITDTGIAPGGGMGTKQTEINEDTTGTKVIAIGVPTVIDVTTIIRDSMGLVHGSNKNINKYIEEYDENLIVTSTDIDTIIKDFSDIIANGINKTLHPGIYS